MNEKMKSLIKNSEICVLATAGPQGPHTSLMGFLASADGGEIFLVTKEATLKYRNIMSDPRVSIMIDDRRPGHPGELCALTITGTAEEVSDTRSEAELLALFTNERPHLCPIASDPGSKVLRVKIKRLQLLEGPTKATYDVTS